MNTIKDLLFALILLLAGVVCILLMQFTSFEIAGIGGDLSAYRAGNCFLFLFQANRPQLIMQIFRKQPASFLTCRLPFSTLFIVLKAADINAGAWAAIRITHRLPDRKTSLSTPDLPQVRRRHQPKYRGGARFARSFR